MVVQAETMYYSENLGMSGYPQQADWSLFNSLPLSDSGFDQYRFFSTLQSHQQHQLHQFHQNLGASLSTSPSSMTCNNLIPSTSSFNNSLHQELDCIIQVQNEKLRFALQEHKKRQLAVILSNVESRMSSLMRQKEEHLSQARKRSMELEHCLRKAQMEMDTWQILAKTNEKMVMNLNNTLVEAKQRTVLNSNEIDDAESSCCGSSYDEKQQVRLGKAGLDCERCNARRACVLFLPCRHLCSCKFCEAFLDCCPVCKSIKETSMEVFLV